MRRLLAVLTALSLGSLQSQALAFHVHAVPDHGHDDGHHHGPAIHHHEDFDRELHIDGDDLSAGGTVSIAVPVGTASDAVAVYAELADALTAPELRLVGDARAIDVRSHGPPPERNSFLRGPPTSALL